MQSEYSGSSSIEAYREISPFGITHYNDWIADVSMALSYCVRLSPHGYVVFFRELSAQQYDPLQLRKIRFAVESRRIFIQIPRR